MKQIINRNLFIFLQPDFYQVFLYLEIIFIMIIIFVFWFFMIYQPKLKIINKKDRRYSEKHEWVLLDSNDKTIGTVGISQYAQESLGDVVYVQLPEIDSEFNQNDEIGAIESVKAANEIYTPVSGTIIDINKNLEEKPGLINTSCYDDGWLFKIRIKDSKEIDGLMDEQAYEEFQKAIP
ncbi:hypothetical protein DERP_004620 [Dermatophagoides pteronyssinus]|uniref:Glycine cleavage system H protein n=1 Tax=Dermatophagoides pteronyssinus TaxID=6956 RepID=A0ABQ8JQ06_DERPT|nr:hypothetical protein DERP_004620 [Dermatophagoides pteronyssinus]